MVDALQATIQGVEATDLTTTTTTTTLFCKFTWLAIPPKVFRNQHGTCLSEELRKSPPDELLPATMVALGGFGRQLPGQRGGSTD